MDQQLIPATQQPKNKNLENHVFLQYDHDLGYVMLSTKINKKDANIHQK